MANNVWGLASQDGLGIDVLAVMLTVALALAVIYVIVGIVLLPVWAIGAAFRVGALRRAGSGWWWLPWTLLDVGAHLIERINAPRDGSRWKRPDRPTAPEPDPDAPVDW